MIPNPTHRRYEASDVLGLNRPVTVEMVKEGFDTSVINALSQYLAISQSELLQYLGISNRTYARRKIQRRLSVEESDQVWRLGSMTAKAMGLFRDREAASFWLRRPAPALNGELPLDLSSTSIGAMEVEQLIGRLEHGIPT